MGPSRTPTPGPVHSLANRLQHAAPRSFTAPRGFKSVFMGVRVGSAGRHAWFWPLSDCGPAAALDGRQRFCTSEGIRPVRLLEINIGAIAYRAMWGYGVDPPTETTHCPTRVRWGQVRLRRGLRANRAGLRRAQDEGLTQRRMSKQDIPPAPPVGGRPGGKPAVTPTAIAVINPSARRPWTPQHDGLQRYKVTHDGTQRKRPAGARMRS